MKEKEFLMALKDILITEIPENIDIDDILFIVDKRIKEIEEEAWGMKKTLLFLSVIPFAFGAFICLAPLILLSEWWTIYNKIWKACFEEDWGMNEIKKVIDNTRKSGRWKKK